MAHTCVEHSDFLKVDVQATTPHSQAQRRFSQNITKKGVMPDQDMRGTEFFCLNCSALAE